MVGDGTNAANLTATQILQNSLTINAGSTVTIAPSDPPGLAAASRASAIDGQPLGGIATSDAALSGTSDPFTAIQEAIADGAISSTTGQVLENRIAAIERLAATDPGLDVSLLESRVLAVLPTVRSSHRRGGFLADQSAAVRVCSRWIRARWAQVRIVAAASAAFAPGASSAGSPAAVPEPSSLLLAALAAAGLAVAAYRRKFAAITNVGR